MDALPYGVIAALIGLCTGIVLGLAARLGEFCTLGAIESAAYGDDQRRLRQWGVVLGTAIFSTFLLADAGLIDLQATIYHSIQWNPLASIAGGLLFGYGMALAGNCGFGALARFGGGDLRSMVVVVVMAIAGFVTLNGPLAQLRVTLFPQEISFVPQGIAHTLSSLTGLPPLAFATVIALGVAAWGLSYAPLRAAPRRVIWGVAAGLAITMAFWGTSALNDQTFGAIPVEGHSFTAPLGRSLLWLMTSSSGGIGFGVGSVAGVLAGAFIGSSIKGLFRWEACEDPRELGRQVSGAIFMGIGGIIAMGCSVGQGLSGMATLAYSGPVTLAAIYGGALFGLRRLIAGFQPD
jgi:uncharacterized protein